ncbi:MAG: recombinase XerC [Comamonadaceae bacterium CG12_big_fil_rev_8_21_14_0_65_59_15]|nr:MAG: recombinase XerC [Comamonadaceae bacterium CG12_big_fil_rev_8_21_14_0_65_59_15]
MSDPLVARYLDHVRFEKRLAERTVTLYALDLDKLCRYAQQAGLTLVQVQPAQVRRWVAQMHSGGRSARGIALILSGWRGFYSWAGREGLVPSNPLADVRAPKASKPLPKALSVDDAVRLASFASAGADPWLEARDQALVELLYGGGLRLGEVTGLDVQASTEARGWVDLQAGEAHVLGKGSKRRVVPVGAQAVRAIERWLQVRHPKRPVAALGADEPGRALGAVSPALFIGRGGQRLTAQSIWKRVRARSLQAGLAAPVHPHMLRHSFASHVLQSSCDLRGVQELLGHANISTTQIYTRLDFSHLAKTYDAAHPRAHLKPTGSK